MEGLRSMCVARLRVAVGAGIWRANHKTLGACGPSGPTPRATSLTITKGLPRRKPGSLPYPPRTSRRHTQSH